MIKFPSRLPAITKNRYEILFFYEDPSLLINKKLNIKLNNEPKNLNNNEKISSNQEKEIVSTIEAIASDVDVPENIKKMLNKSNNQKKKVTVKNIGDINKKNNISYLNNYNIYSKLACSKFYFYYRDEDSLMKRLSGKKEFEYKCEGQNSILKTTLKYLRRSTLITKLLNKLIPDDHIKSFNKHVNYLKNIFNNNISNIQNLPELKNLNNTQIKKKVNDLKINIINNIRKKDKKYEKSSDEEITKFMLEKINKLGIINKDDILENSKLHLNKDFLDLTKEQQEEIKNILKLKKSNSGNIIKKSKKEYFENNIKEAFEKIQEINPNIKYCLVLDIKKSLPYKLNKVDKEYNIQMGGNPLFSRESTFLSLVTMLIVMYIFLLLASVYHLISLIISSFVRIGPFNTHNNEYWRRLDYIALSIYEIW